MSVETTSQINKIILYNRKRKPFQDSWKIFLNKKEV